jgi:hypothetical protein
MDSTRSEVRSTGFAAGASIVLAACAGLLLASGDAIGFATPETEGIFTVLYLAGWMFLSGALLVGVVAVVLLIRSLVSSRRLRLLDVLLLVAAAAVVTGVVWTHPLAGAGSGVG